MTNYTKHTWHDYAAPAINQTHLNEMEDGIDNAQADNMQLRGAAASKPVASATTIGRLYIETDSPYKVWRDSGAGWDQVGFAPNAAGYPEVPNLIKFDVAKSAMILGYQAGMASTGVYNTILGHQAFFSNTTGTGSIAVGWRALYFNVSGGANSALGGLALYGNISGTHNCAFGSATLYANTTGKWNTAFGDSAAYGNITGSDNVIVGDDARRLNTAGSYDVVVGDSALYHNTTGGYNTIIGGEAGHINVVGSRNVFLGYRAGYSELGSDKLYIHNDDIATPLIWGDFAAALLGFNARVGIGTHAPATSAKLEIAGTTGALLLSRLTTVEKNALTAVNGMIVYDVTLNRLEAYENGAWVDL